MKDRVTEEFRALLASAPNLPTATRGMGAHSIIHFHLSGGASSQTSEHHNDTLEHPCACVSEIAREARTRQWAEYETAHARHIANMRKLVAEGRTTRPSTPHERIQDFVRDTYYAARWRVSHAGRALILGSCDTNSY